MLAFTMCVRIIDIKYFLRIQHPIKGFNLIETFPAGIYIRSAYPQGSVLVSDPGWFCRISSRKSYSIVIENNTIGIILSTVTATWAHCPSGRSIVEG